MIAKLVELLFVVAPKVLSGGAQLLFGVLMLRYFGTGPFGEISVCLSSVVLADAIFGGAVDMVLLRLAPPAEERDPLWSLSLQQAGLWMKPAGAILAAIPCALFAGPLSRLMFQRADGGTLIWLAIAGLFGTLLLRSVQMRFQVQRRFGPYGLLDLISSVGRYGSIAVLMYTRTAMPANVLLAWAVAPLIVSAAALAFTESRILLQRFPHRAAFGEVWGTLRWYLGSIAVGALAGRVDLLLVSGVADVREAGIYAAAQVFAIIPQILGTYISVVVCPRVMPLYQQGRLGSRYIAMQIALGVIAVLAFALVYCLQDILAERVLPARFALAMPVLLVLLPSGLTQFLNFPFTIPLLMFVRPGYLLALDGILLPIAVAAHILMIHRFGAIGAAGVSSAFALLKTILMQLTAGRLVAASDRAVPAATPIFESAARV